MTTVHIPVSFRLADGVWTDEHTLIPWKHTTALIDRWVYVLAKTTPDGAPWLYAEIYFDNKGRMLPLDMNKARKEKGKRKAPLRPSLERRNLARQTDPAPSIRLMTDILGEAVDYWVWGSPFPISQAGLDEIAKAATAGAFPKFYCHEDGVPASYYGVNDPYRTGTYEGLPDTLPHVPAFDPHHLALVLSNRLRRFVDARVRLVEDRGNANRHLVAVTLKSMLDSGLFNVKRYKTDDDWRHYPSVAHDPLAMSGRGEMDSWLKTFEKKLHGLGEGAEKVSEELVKFLEGEAWKTYERSATSEDEPVFAHYMDGIVQATESFADTEAGKRYLADALESDSTFIKKFVAPAAADKELDAKAQAWFKAYQKQAKKPEKLAGYLGRTSLAVTFSSVAKAEKLAKGCNLALGKAGERAFKVEKITIGTKTAFALKPTGEPLAKTGFLATVAGAGREVAGMFELQIKVLEVASWLKTKDADASTVLGGMSALNDLAAMGAGKASLERVGKLLGVVGAGLSLTSSVIEAGNAKEADVAVGKWISCAGAAVGLAAAVFGGPAALVTIAAVMGTSGSVVASICEDTPLEIFVRHCFWGERYGKPASPPIPEKDWTRGRLQDWSKLEGRAQVQALATMLCSFVVSKQPNGIDYNAPIRVDCGMLPPGARYRIEWSSARTAEQAQWSSCKMYVEPSPMGFRVLAQDGRTDISNNLGFWRCSRSPGERPWFEISTPTGYLQNLWAVAYVSLELLGRDGLTQIPDQPMRFVRCRGSADKCDASKSTIDAPHDDPEVTVVAYDPPRTVGDFSLFGSAVDHPGAPVSIGLKNIPRTATLRVSWSVGNSWTYACSELERSGNGWRLQGDPSLLRLYETTNNRVRISFPKAIDWNAMQPVKVRVELVTPSGRGSQPIDYFVRNREQKPDPAASNQSTM